MKWIGAAQRQYQRVIPRRRLRCHQHHLPKMEAVELLVVREMIRVDLMKWIGAVLLWVQFWRHCSFAVCSGCLFSFSGKREMKLQRMKLEWPMKWPAQESLRKPVYRKRTG